MVNIWKPWELHYRFLSRPIPFLQLRTHRLERQSSVHPVEIEHRRPDFCSRSLMGVKVYGRGYGYNCG